MNKVISLTVNRVGEFETHEESEHPNQCGTTGRREYKYRVAITGDSRNLDDKGFIIDNAVIHDYFMKYYQDKKVKCESCEMMACAAIAFIQKYCEENNIKNITKLVVELWGSDHSFITAEWQI